MYSVKIDFLKFNKLPNILLSVLVSITSFLPFLENTYISNKYTDEKQTHTYTHTQTHTHTQT